MRAVPGGTALAQIALLEGRRLALHPAFLAGLVVAAGGCVAFLARDTSTRASWHVSGWTVYAGFALLAPFTMIATNIVTLRDRRAATVEQHEAMPVPVSTRVGGVLTAILVPTLISAVALATITSYVASRIDLDAVDLLVIGSLPLIMTTLATLGVALARWLPTPFAAPALALALYLWTPGSESSTWQTLMPLNSADDAWSATLRLGYLAGLTLVFAGAALAQPRRSRVAVLLLCAGGAVVAGSALAILS